MKQYRILETIIGAIIIIIVIAFSMKIVTHISWFKIKQNSYTVYAQFHNAGGINVDASVTINGVKIGSVTSINLDDDYTITIALKINKPYKIPTDSIVSILSNGIIGGKYIAIIPGEKTEYIKNNGSISKFKDFQSLESLIYNALTK